MRIFFFLVLAAAAGLRDQDRVQCVQSEWVCTASGKMVPAPASLYGLPVEFKRGVNASVSVPKNPRLEHRDVFLAVDRLVEDSGWKYVIGIGSGEWFGTNMVEILGQTTFIGIVVNGGKDALTRRYPKSRWLSIAGGGPGFRVETDAVELASDVVFVVGNVLETEIEPEHLLNLLFGKDDRLSLAYRRLVLQFSPRTTNGPQEGFYWQWKRDELAAHIKATYNATARSEGGSNMLVFGARTSAVLVEEETYSMLGKPLSRPVVSD
jgi:hypothetical protein